MKKSPFTSLSALALAITLTVTLSACGTDNSTQTTTTNPPQASTPTPKKYSEEYVVGIDIGSPPFSMKNEIGHKTGFEVEILQAIGEDQKFGVVFVGETRTKLYQAMDNGKYQIMVASLEINPNNEAKFEMSNPHATSYRAILTRKDRPLSSSADLVGKGKVGVQENTISAKLLQEAGADIQEFPNLLANFQAFARNETQFLVGNAVPLSHYIEQYQSTHQQALSDVVMVSYDNPIKNNDIAFGIAKGNTQLKDKINAGLANIHQNGTYDKIYKKWFGANDIARVKH